MTLAPKPLAFAKMSGAGNDFILIDNRDGKIGPQAAEMARRFCRRRVSLGADGLILIEADGEVDFSWRFFNDDGSTAEMCGNGARCAARFAFMQGIAGPRMRFRTLAGIIEAEMQGDQVEVALTRPGPLVMDLALDLDGRTVVMDAIDTGVPHVVIFVSDLAGIDVAGIGRRIRRHPQFVPAGTNVNFAEVLSPGLLAVRTYERGVEIETLACGTGASAAALAASARFGWTGPITAHTQSGSSLTIGFIVTGDGFDQVKLQGEARLICSGKLGVDAWQN